jgi:hypothetical protein
MILFENVVEIYANENNLNFGIFCNLKKKWEYFKKVFFLLF